MCGVAEIAGPDISNIEMCLMADEVTNNSQFLYYESDDGIEDLELVKSELDRYEKEFLEAQSKTRILEESKETLEKEVSELTRVSENKNAEIAFLKAQISENENSHKLALDELTKKMMKLLSENEELRKKELSFQSYAKASDTLTEVQSYLRDPSEKGGLGLDEQSSNSSPLKKSDERLTFVKSQQNGSSTTYSIGQKARVVDKGKGVATQPLKEQQVHKKHVDKVSEKKHNPQTCNHPQCYITRKGRIAGIGKFSTVPFYENKDGAETSKASEERIQKAKGVRNGIGYRAIGKVLLQQYKEGQEQWRKADIARSNRQKWKKSQATEKLNARARRNLVRKAKFAEKQPQKPRIQKAPKGTPRNTPRRKIEIKITDFIASPSDQVRQKQTPKKFTKMWIPTGRMFSLNGSISEART